MLFNPRFTYSCHRFDLNHFFQDESWDFGSGAGFYLNATEAPWSKHYRMFDYVNKELPELIGDLFAVDMTK